MRLSARRTSLLAVISVIGRAPGFLIPVLVAAVFGAGSQTDAYFIAYGAVLLIGGTLAQGVEVSIVPFAAREMLGSEGNAPAFLRSIALKVMAAGLALWVLTFPVLFFVSGASLRVGVIRYAACFTLLVVMWGWAAVYAGASVSRGRIGTATGSMLWRGAGGLLGLALAPIGAGLWGVGLGLGIGELCRAVWLRSQVLRSPRGEVTDNTPASGPSFAQAATALVLAGVAGSTVPVVEKLLAVSVGVGAASHLEYATRLLIIPTVLFDGAIAPQLLAAWSRTMVARGEIPSRREVLVAVGKGLGIAFGCGVLLAIFAPQIVAILLRHGRFTTEDAYAVSMLLRVLAIGFVGSMGALLVERSYVAAGRNRVLALSSVVRLVLRTSVAVTLLKALGLLAFGVGYLLAEWCYFLVLVARLPATRPFSAITIQHREAEA